MSFFLDSKYLNTVRRISSESYSISHYCVEKRMVNHNNCICVHIKLNRSDYIASSTPTNAHYKHVQLHTVTLHKHISVTVPTIIRVAYNKNTNNMQIIFQKCVTLQLICNWNVTPSGFIIHFYTTICILTVFLS
jgi:hypothetical protein